MEDLVATHPPHLRNYINGAWRAAKAGEALPVTNPSTGETWAEVPLSSAADTCAAVAAARAAFPAWGRTPAATRVQYLFRQRAELEAHAAELGRVIITEMGKSLPDGETEVERALQNLETACGMPHPFQGYKVVGVASDLDTETVRLPLGVFASIAPSFFPLIVLLWFFPYAIAAGDT